MNTSDFIFAQQSGVFHSLAVCALFALASFGIGVLVSRRSDMIAFASGFLLTGILFYLTGLFFSPAVFTSRLFSAVLSAAALPGVYFFCRSFFRNKILFSCLGLLFAAAAASALLPPYAWDEQVYQIELLSRYLRNGSLAVLKDNPYSAWPGFLQGFLLPGYITGGLNFPRLFNTLLTVILAGTLFSALRPFGRKTAAVLTFAVILSPLALILTRSLYAENTTAVFAAAGGLVLYRMRKKGAQAALLAGIFAGAAAAVKLTSGGVVLALLLLCFAGKKTRKFFYLFFIGGAAVCLPYFLRVWFETGNPVYPFAAALFGTSQAVESHHHLLGSYRYGLGPLTGTVFGWLTTAFYGRIYDGATTGIQQIVLLVLLFYSRRFGSGRYSCLLNRLTAALAVLYLFWGFTSQQCRFLYPALFFLAFAAAAALKGLTPGAGKIFLILVLAGTFLSSGFYAQAKHFFISWRLLDPARKEPLRFLAFAQNDPDFIQILEAAGRTPPRSRIYLLFEKRGLYLPRAHELADPRFQEKFFQKLPASVDELMEELSGADYLLLGSNEKNVDLQESEIAVQQHLLSLISAAMAQGKLTSAAAGSRNSCHLLKINNLTK